MPEAQAFRKQGSEKHKIALLSGKEAYEKSPIGEAIKSAPNTFLGHLKAFYLYLLSPLTKLPVNASKAPILNKNKLLFLQA